MKWYFILLAGVVAVLPSFSRPLLSMVQRLAVALATANTVVVCPSSATPLSALLFAEVCREAGLPAGVVNVLTDGRECGGMRKLVLREEVDKVAYAGTTRVRIGVGLTKMLICFSTVLF